jgi:hypothetical protein
MGTLLCHRGIRVTGAVLSMCLIVTGCSVFAGGAKLHKSARGSVYLKEVADWSFEANHPAVLDQTTIHKMLKGVMTDDAPKTSTNVPASGSKPMRIFSDEDAEFLAPLLAQALSQARPEQIVGFTVSPSAGSGAEPAAGTLYVQQGSIYLTLDPSRGRRGSTFVPTSVARVEKAASYAGGGGSEAVSLVIDYQALARASLPASSPVAVEPKPPTASSASVATEKTSAQPQPSSASAAAVSLTEPSFSQSSELSNDELLNKKLDELRQAREAAKMKESEISLLKKEIAWLKQELRERTAEVKAMKAERVSRSGPSKKKTVEARPIR